MNSKFVIEDIEQLAFHFINELFRVSSCSDCVEVAGLSIIASGVIAEKFLDVTFVSVTELLPS